MLDLIAPKRTYYRPEIPATFSVPFSRSKRFTFVKNNIKTTILSFPAIESYFRNVTRSVIFVYVDVIALRHANFD